MRTTILCGFIFFRGRLHSRLIALVFNVMFAQCAFAQTLPSQCGELANHFGPYDYRLHAGSIDFKVNKNNPLYLVEMAHFRPEMVALRHGGQGVKSEVGPEFDYTLRAFPNHHRALDALIRLAEKKKSDQPDMRYTVSCWFQRAIAFKPDDAIVRMLFATYLGRKNRIEEAVEQLRLAARVGKDNPFTQYNVGLALYDLKQYDGALAQAHIAYGMGMQRRELREQLEKSGHWRDPSGVAGPTNNTSGATATN